jgi:hypothetical protein
MTVLSRLEVQIIRTLARAFFPEQDPEAQRVVERRVVGYIDAFVADLPRFERLKIRSLFPLLEYGYGAATLSPGARLTEATPEDQAAFLDTLEMATQPALRGSYQMVRMLATMGYFADGATQERIGTRAPTNHPSAADPATRSTDSPTSAAPAVEPATHPAVSGSRTRP